MIMQIYVSDEDMATLRMIALERECAAADLAEAAVSEACLAVRKERRPREALAQLNLSGIDRALVLVRDAMQPPSPLVDIDPAEAQRIQATCPHGGGGIDFDGGHCDRCQARSGGACRLLADHWPRS